MKTLFNLAMMLLLMMVCAAPSFAKIKIEVGVIAEQVLDTCLMLSIAEQLDRDGTVSFQRLENDMKKCVLDFAKSLEEVEE